MARAEELVATGAGTVATACPFCASMFKDALKSVSPDPPKLLDVVQITAASLEKISLSTSHHCAKLPNPNFSVE